MYAKWIKSGLEKQGKSAIGLAEFLTKALKLKKPMHRITVHKMTSGIRKVKSEELVPVSQYLEEPIPNVRAAQVLGSESMWIHIEREIGLGLWFEQGLPQLEDLGTIEAPHDIQFPDAKPIAYAFKGDSMVKGGILNGDIVICVQAPANYEAIEGQSVIIERSRAGLIELSARVVSKLPDRTEYRVCSDNSSYKPVVVHHSKKNKGGNGSENETVRVVAIIRRTTRIFS